MINKAVEIIPQKQKLNAKVLTAVYCRVSTKAERQEDSLENQIQHYTDALSSSPNNTLTEIYYDFGISGYKETRPGFQKMMADAEEHRFDLLITKSITRFARNTNTVLTATRRLKELGIGVFFELQGINTLSQEGELLMTLYAAFGQAESEGARTHTLMAIRRKYEEGHPPRQLQRSMGYTKGDDGEFYPDEYAPLVLEIFEMAADGYTAAQISNYLNAEGITIHNGKAFSRSGITRILRNPAYKGDFIGQRFYVDENRKLTKNVGVKPMYYIEEDHIPIVTRQLWSKAQETLDAATHKVQPTESQALLLNDENYPYRNQLFCAGCGHRLNRSVRAGRVLWECNGKARFSQDFCTGVCVTDDEIRSWLPLPEDEVYVYASVDRGKIIGHSYTPAAEWKKTHRKKKYFPASSAPELNETNYPYMNRIFCKYCGSRLRRIVSNAGKVSWLCDAMSRRGKKYCKGVRIPDEKLKPLANQPGVFYIGKEKVNGTESYGYSRKPDGCR